MSFIHHIWFDFSETLASLREENHNRLRYSSYAEVTGRTLTPELIAEYEALYQKNGHNNTAIFRSLGMPRGYWSGRVYSMDPRELYQLADKNIPDVLQKLKNKLPISIFSNIELHRALSALGIDPTWFKHILSSAQLKEPKPALEGFYKMIELSQLPPNEILYIGDSLQKDILPAKKVGMLTGLVYQTSDQADYCFERFEDILPILE